MNTTSLQTTTNVSDSGGTGHRKLILKTELAQALSVSPRTIDNWVRQKRIPVLRFSPRLVRFDLCKVLIALDKFEIREVGRGL